MISYVLTYPNRLITDDADFSTRRKLGVVVVANIFLTHARIRLFGDTGHVIRHRLKEAAAIEISSDKLE